MEAVASKKPKDSAPDDDNTSSISAEVPKMSQSSEVLNKINDIFEGRVAWAMKKAALDVMAEPVGTHGHVARAAFSELVLSGDINYRQYAIAVTTNAAIAANMDGADGNESLVPDGDLLFTVNSMFNAFAGVSVEAA